MTDSALSDVPDCRSRLLQAALEIFVREGYRASIDRIAARAGVARQTLYNHFPSKAELFGEVIRQATAAMLVVLDDHADSLRERLLRFGAAYRCRVLSAEGLGFFRMLAAESLRFPDLAASVYENGPAQTAARLGALLESAMQGGELRQADPDFAATMLLSMLVGADKTRYLFSGDLPAASDLARVEPIIDCYLRAFAPAEPSAAPCAADPSGPAIPISLPLRSPI